mmetsp:Transcript_38543/g.121473  ORF Transcript_38543/g.121473 Transcript_38543/m.121473 type:complete len:393 (-) Transcript_38543:2604-3782(-)
MSSEPPRSASPFLLSLLQGKDVSKARHDALATRSRSHRSLKLKDQPQTSPGDSPPPGITKRLSHKFSWKKGTVLGSKTKRHVLRSQYFDEEILLDALLVLKDSPVFRGISEDALSSLIPKARFDRLMYGSCVRKEGKVDEDMIVVMEGQVSIHRSVTLPDHCKAAYASFRFLSKQDSKSKIPGREHQDVNLTVAVGSKGTVLGDLTAGDRIATESCYVASQTATILRLKVADMLAVLEQDHIKMMHGQLDRALRWRDRLASASISRFLNVAENLASVKSEAKKTFSWTDLLPGHVSQSKSLDMSKDKTLASKQDTARSALKETARVRPWSAMTTSSLRYWVPYTITWCNPVIGIPAVRPQGLRTRLLTYVHENCSWTLGCPLKDIECTQARE